MSTEIAFYRDLLGDIKTRVRKSQHKAALSANAEMILMYWDIGRMISTRQEKEGWGAGVIPRLAVDLKNELPEEKGFSERNIKLMIQFSREYPKLFAIGAPPVPQLQNGSGSNAIGQRAVAPIGARSAFRQARHLRGGARPKSGIRTMTQPKSSTMEVQGTVIAILSDWLRNRNTIYSFGIWESVFNLPSECCEFAALRSSRMEGHLKKMGLLWK